MAEGRNAILEHLDEGDRARLIEAGEVRRFAQHDILVEQLHPIQVVAFPLTGIVSFVQRMEGGASVEALAAGNEGMVGVEIALGAPVSPSLVLWQVPGQALLLDADILRAELERTPALLPAILRYVHAREVFLIQSTACNRLHTTDDRLARWLLHTLDRVEGTTFEMTQDFLAQMLGTRRASVTDALGRLASAGQVELERGRIRVVDRPGLEERACECYATINRWFEMANLAPW